MRKDLEAVRHKLGTAKAISSSDTAWLVCGSLHGFSCVKLYIAGHEINRQQGKDRVESNSGGDNELPYLSEMAEFPRFQNFKDGRVLFLGIETSDYVTEKEMSGDKKDCFLKMVLDRLPGCAHRGQADSPIDTFSLHRQVAEKI